jgi:outer membrane receptor protein involved in Fe transport
VAFIVTNVGEARSQGVELDLHLRPDTRWHFGLNAAYLDAKYIDYPRGPCSSGQNANLVPGCTGSPRFQNFAGVATQFTSKWSGTFDVEYTAPVRGDNEVAAGLSVFARSKYDSSLYNDARTIQGGYALLNGHVDFGPADGRWRISLFGRNLNDLRVLEYSSVTPVNSTSTIGSYARGRQIGIKLSFNVN